MTAGKFGLCCCPQSSSRFARARKELYGGPSFRYTNGSPEGGPVFTGSGSTRWRGDFTPASPPLWCGHHITETYDGRISNEYREQVDWWTGKVSFEVRVPFDPDITLPTAYGTVVVLAQTPSHFHSLYYADNNHVYGSEITLFDPHTWSSALADLRSLCLAGLAHAPPGNYDVRVQQRNEPSPGARVFTPVGFANPSEGAAYTTPGVFADGFIHMKVMELVAERAALLHYGRSSGSYLFPARCSDWQGGLIEADVWRKSVFDPPADPDVYHTGVIDVQVDTDCAHQTLFPGSLIA